MLSVDALPADILLQIIGFHDLGLKDALSLSLVNKSFCTLSQEPSFWLGPLRSTRHAHPLPIATFTTLTGQPTAALKQLALYYLRLQRNWAQPFPVISRRTRIATLECGGHNSILYCLPGTDAIVLYDADEGTVLCANMRSGERSAPMEVGRVVDMSSPLEEPGSFTVAALIWNEKIVVLKATCSPELSTEVVLECTLDQAYHHCAVFMNSFTVGVARTLRNGADGPIEIQTFALRDPALSTVIITDRPRSRVLGSSVIGDTIFFIILQLGDAFVYACPRRLLAGAAPALSSLGSLSLPEVDFTLARSHLARVPRPPLLPSRDEIINSLEEIAAAPPPRVFARSDYCVLSTEPNHGRSTISIARVFEPVAGQGGGRHALEITFWPRPYAAVGKNSDSGVDTDTEKDERARHKLMMPAHTVAVPGSLSNQPGTAWELLVIANSGLAVILLVDPPPEAEPAPEPEPAPNDNAAAPAPADGQTPAPALAAESETGAPAPPPPAPKLILVRYYPALNQSSVHELRMPSGTESETALDTRDICALALDDHRGIVIVITKSNVLHAIPYA